jgi:SAM-dependent methyltransferase
VTNPRFPPLAPRARLRWDVVSRVLGRFRGATVIEVGCGQGAMGARIAVGRSYTGVEPDVRSAERARAVIEPNGGTVLTGLTAEFDLEPAPLVCAFEVLEHIDDDRAALAEWVRLIAPGGTLLLSVPAFQRRFGASDVRSGHFRRYDPALLRERLTEAGLTDIRITVYAWPLGYLLEAVRNRREAFAEGETAPTIEELTAASGRAGQTSNPLLGLVITVGTAPFALLQRLAPRRGTGLVATAVRPAGKDT